MARGELSFSKVRALTRVATEQNEVELLEVAKAGTAAHVEKLVRAMRRATGPADCAEANRQHDQRYLQLILQDDGTLELRGKLTAELGAVVQKALERAVEQSERSDDAEATSHGQKMADALVQVAESALSADIARGVPAERVQVVVHVASSASKGESASAAPLACSGRSHEDEGVSAETSAASNGPSESRAFSAFEITEAVIEPGGVGLAEQTARRLCCDASVVFQPPEVAGAVSGVSGAGRKKRVPRLALRRALWARDRGCAFPGCDHQRHLEAHHIEHWIDGGPTCEENLLLVCSFHHRLLHEGGFRCQWLDGTLAFTDPCGRRISENPPLLRSADGGAALRQRDEDALIDWQTMPLWQGDKMDLSWIWGPQARPDESLSK
jgi:hypothetical protein